MRSIARLSLPERRTLMALAIAPALLAGCAAAPDAEAPRLADAILPAPVIVASLNRVEMGGKTPSALAPPRALAVVPPAASVAAASAPAPGTARPATTLALAPGTALVLPAAWIDAPRAADPAGPAPPTAEALLYPCKAPHEAGAPCREPPSRLATVPIGCDGPGPCSSFGDDLLLAGNISAAEDEPDRKLKLTIYEDDDIGDLRVVWGRGTGIGLRWVVPFAAD